MAVNRRNFRRSRIKPNNFDVEDSMVEPTSFEQMIRDCGVTEETLSRSDKESLERNGYVVFRDVIDVAWLEQLRSEFEKAAAKGSSALVVKDSGTRHIDNLVSRAPEFERGYTQRPLLHAGCTILVLP